MYCINLCLRDSCSIIFLVRFNVELSFNKLSVSVCYKFTQGLKVTVCNCQLSHQVLKNPNFLYPVR